MISVLGGHIRGVKSNGGEKYILLNKKDGQTED
jgi:hypothetical protein